MKNILLLLSLLTAIVSFAQDYQSLGKELQSKHKEKEAAVLNSAIKYEFVQEISKSVVKIRETKEEKLISLRYNSSIGRSEIYDSNSELINMSASSSLKQKVYNANKICGNYTSEGFFYDDSKFCLINLNLKEIGEVWTVNSEMKINDSRYLTSIYFQEKFPVLEKKIVLEVPADIEVELKEFNFEDYNITKSVKSDGGKKIIEYTGKDLPGLNKEGYERGVQYNHPHLLVMVKSITTQGKKINILSNTKDLYNWYGSLVKQLKPKPEVFKKTVEEIIANKTTDEDKVKAIFYWVQDNVRYIAFEDGIAAFKPDEAHNVFEKKYGDCKGMANLTKEMLKSAGYDARLTWVGTKKIRYDYSIPSLAVDNHMICTVILKDKKYFLDATEKYIPFGEYAERIQNRPVLIEDGDNYILDKVPNANKVSNLESKDLNFKLVNERLEGSYKLNIHGEGRKNFLYGYHYTKNQKKEDFIKEYITESEAKVNDLKYSDTEDRSGPFNIEAAISYGGVSAFNNELYIDIDPAKEFKNWEIKQDRQNDVDFGEKIHRKTKISMQIPSGYKVNHLPENLSINDPEFSFILKYQVQGNTIVYVKEISIEEGVIVKSSFNKWNEAIKKLNKNYLDQIILSK